MERLLFIVADARRDLYEALRKVLASEKGVEVILDRRVVRRRHREEPAAGDTVWMRVRCREDGGHPLLIGRLGALLVELVRQ